MKIEIETSELEESRLFPSEYVFLLLINNKDYDLIQKIYCAYGDKLSVYLYDRIKELAKNGWLFEGGYYDKDKIESVVDLSKIVLRQKALDLFITDDVETKWFHFKSLYPIKDNERRLHDSQDKCKERFIKLVLNRPGTYKEIIRGLENELEGRRVAGIRRNFFPAMKLMSSWINSKGWLTYLHSDTAEEEQETGTNEVGI